MRIAVVGSGISGIAAAWILSENHHVTMYEAADRFGGHSRTLEVDTESGPIPVDTGFIVFNERNYPNLTAFFDVLGIETIASDMSFAVSTDDRAFEYAGRASGIFPRIGSFTDARRWNIVRGLRMFRSEKRRLDAGAVPEDATVIDYLTARDYPADFLELYLLPLAAAVWSGTRNNVGDMPVATFLRFLDNHGLLSLTTRPQWRTVAGGAKSYVERATKEITAAYTGRGVAAVRRQVDGVVVTDNLGIEEEFDQIVFATHADVTLSILGSDATGSEQSGLGAFGYDRNEVVLHTDARAMPVDRNLWSAWNAIERTDDDGSMPVSVTYWMNKLQSLGTQTDIFVTLNPGDSLDERAVLDRWHAMHPQFTVATQVAQKAIGRIQGLNRTWFTGAHLGHGFHEDGIRSAVEVAAALGSPAPWNSSASSSVSPPTRLEAFA